MITWQCALLSHAPVGLACSHANVPCVPTCSRGNVNCLFTYQCAVLAYVICQRERYLGCSACLRGSVVHAHLQKRSIFFKKEVFFSPVLSWDKKSAKEKRVNEKSNK